MIIPNAAAEVPPGELLASIQELIKELLRCLMQGSLPCINMDKFQLRSFADSDASSLGIFEKSKVQETVSLETGGARRMTAVLRVLQIIQTLLQQGKHSTKRDLYYTDPGLLKNSQTVNQALIDICIKLKCTRSSLHVVSVSKGLVMGALRFREEGRTRDCCICKSRAFPIPPDAKQVTDISSPAEYILVVEKETVFQRLGNDGFCIKNNCIVITGKGYPDISTRSFLRLLVSQLHVPVYGLVDNDPYGIDILATYRFGSLTMAYDANALATPNIRWIGVFLSDCGVFNVPERCLLPLTARDKSKAEAMLKRDYMRFLAPSWSDQLKLMLDKGVKFEVEAISSSQFSALCDDYVPKKIRTGSFLY